MTIDEQIEKQKKTISELRAEIKCLKRGLKWEELAHRNVRAQRDELRKIVTSAIMRIGV